MTALLEAQHVTKVFGGGLFDRTRTIALDDFSMAIGGETPSITAVVGESGSGKTTLARLLLGVTSPTTGSVRYKGKDLRKLTKDESRGFLNDVQVIFQDPFEVYNPFYHIDHVLTTPIDYMNLAKSRLEKWKLIERALETVGLRPEETLGRYPHQLSGGQRQRVMVARALILKPRVILADEPVSMIDASLRATVLGSLQKIKEEFGISIVYITHDLTTAIRLATTSSCYIAVQSPRLGVSIGSCEIPAIRILACWSVRSQLPTPTASGRQRLLRRILVSSVVRRHVDLPIAALLPWINA